MSNEDQNQKQPPGREASAHERLVSLPLSLALLEKLNEVLWDHQDEGPWGEGWASNELEELRSLTDQALEDAKAG